MSELNNDDDPECSNYHEPSTSEIIEETATRSSHSQASMPKPFEIPSQYSQSQKSVLIKSYESLPLSVISQTITTQPRFSMKQLHSSNTIEPRTQPLSLFMQALSKLNENPVNMAGIDPNMLNTDAKLPDLTPPGSLTSAPPSYSFVLRQTAAAARRRPRLMGTFIPSPSFVQHPPPPTYATAFDIYVEPVPQPPTRVYNYGFTSIPAICPECGHPGMTVITSKVTICTHMCAFLLCVFCCWICAPLPYILKSCKDVYHHCRNCGSYLGMYCPTNPDHAYM